MKKYEVDEQFIKEAHAAACNDWKSRLEKKFPDAFPGKLKIVSDIVGSQRYFEKPQIGEVASYVYVSFQLPYANIDWTFNVFDNVKDLIAKVKAKGFSAYAVHGQEYRDKTGFKFETDRDYIIVRID